MRQLLIKTAALTVAFSLLLFTFNRVVPLTKMGYEPKALGTSSFTSRGMHSIRFFEQSLFLNSLQRVPDTQEVNYIKGGIIPHHLLPAEMLANFFKKISHQTVETYILIGPNHYEKGQSKILTSDWDWNTPFGEVKANTQAIDGLVKVTAAEVNTDVLEYEHSVAGIMPYLKHFSPSATVVPLILSNTVTANELTELAEKIQPFITKNTVILAPVDFSHYLRSREAEEHDKVTWEAMKNFDIDHLLHMNHDNLDSPSSIALLLLLMKREGTTSMHLYENTNSGKLLNSPYVSTTSYFSIGFTE